MVYLKIALRNLLKNKKRTILIGLTLIISCTFLLMSYAIGNGIGKQIMQKFRTAQSGDIAVVWQKVKDLDVSDPSRLFYSEYDIKQDKENKAAIQRLNTFLKAHAEDIEVCFQPASGSGMLDTGRYASYSIIQGVTPEELAYLQKNRQFELVAGDTPFDYEYGICVSEDMASKYGVRLGDWVILDSDTARGFVNTLDYQVVGFYKSSSDYDSVYVYMPRENALELLDQDPEYFKVTRIYLKKPAKADEFAKKLDNYLTNQTNPANEPTTQNESENNQLNPGTNSTGLDSNSVNLTHNSTGHDSNSVNQAPNSTGLDSNPINQTSNTTSSGILRAESINFSAKFFSTIADFQKNIFSSFVIFILFIIAIGIRSAVGMNLFERMREFGTLRAIGFNRKQSFYIIFLEIFLLALTALATALMVTLALVLILRHTGIHIGKGAIAYALGGENIYPVFVLRDTLMPLLVITLFSLFAPLKPGLRLCQQKITDLLAQDQKPLSAILSIYKSTIQNRKQRLLKK